MSEPKEFTRYLKKVTEEDLARLEEVLHENPKDLDVLDWLAFANYSSGHYQRAAELYERCLELEPGSASFHYFLGNCYWHTHATERAGELWRRVIELDAEGKFRMRATEKLKLLKS